MTRKWHIISLDDIQKELNTSAVSGLSRKQRHQRRQEKNNLFLKDRKPAVYCLLEVFKDPLCILLPLLAILAAFFDRVALGVTVLSLTLAGDLLIGASFLHAQRVNERMRRYSNPLVRVIRDGKLFTVDAREICTGDLIVFSKGDIIPCDARLIFSDDLRVTEFEKVNGKVVSHVSRKDHSYVYTETSPVHAPDYQNMVYGGSAVLSGSGRAICVAVGDGTYLGALTGGIAPSVRKDDNAGLKWLKRYYRAFNIISAGLMIPFSFIGIIFLTDIDAIDVFLTALALVCTSSGNCIAIYGRVVAASEASRTASDGEDGCAVFKNTLVHDKLCSADTLFLLGRAGISDGRYRVERTFAHGSETASPSLIGCAYMFDLMKRSMPALYSDDDTYMRRYSDCINGFAVENGIDPDEYRLKIRSTAYVPCPADGTEGAEIKFTDGTDTVIFASRGTDLIDACDLERDGDRLIPIGDAGRGDLLGYRERAIGNGYIVLSYSTVTDGDGVFEGFIMLKERADASLAYNIDELAAMGTDTRIFLHGATAEDTALLHDAGIYDIAVCDGKTRLAEIFDKHRAFLGFSREEISAQIDLLHSENHVIAAAGVSYDDFRLMNKCDAVISFDKLGAQGEIYENSYDGYDSSGRCSQITRMASDVLINRTDGSGNGIASVKRAFLAVRRAYGNLADMVGVLIISQFARLFFTVFPLLLGKSYLLTAPEILFSGLLIDFFTVLIFSSSDPSADKLSPKMNIPKNVIHPISGARSRLISGAVSSVAAVGIAELIYASRGIDGADGRNVFMFLSLILIQFSCLFTVLMSRKTKAERNFFKTPGALFWTAFLSFTVIFAVAAAFSGLKLRFIDYALTPIVPAVFFLTDFIIRKIIKRI